MIKLVKKDLKLFFGNKRDMLITFVLPIIFISLFSFIFGNMNNDEEGKLVGIVHSVAGTAVLMLLFSVAGIGESILEEKQEGMLKKLLCSPMHPNNILFGKIVFTNIISIAQLIIMFVFAWLVFGLDITHHLFSLVLMIFATAYACSSFGIFLSSFAKSRKQVQALSTIIIMVMSGIGGSMVPLFVMPEIMQKIAVFTVNYWGIQGFYDIFWRLVPLTDITFLSRVFVLLCIGTSLNFFALLIFKKNILRIV
ncbi:ABC transporter permease [Bacteroidota bacterium]